MKSVSKHWLVALKMGPVITAQIAAHAEKVATILHQEGGTAPECHAL